MPQFGKVWLSIGENADYSHSDASSAPYLSTAARQQSAPMDNYFAATHWSQANDVALATEQFTSCDQHDGGTACHQDVDNIYHQPDQTGASWKV